MAEWVKRELLANEGDELNSNKERVKQFIRLTPDGNVIVNNKQLTSRLQIVLYFIGLAYAKAAGLREDDTASNKEIADRLGFPVGTVHPKIKELREDHSLIVVGEGIHRINYARIGNLLDEAKRHPSEAGMTRNSV